MAEATRPQVEHGRTPERRVTDAALRELLRSGPTVEGLIASGEIAGLGDHGETSDNGRYDRHA